MLIKTMILLLSLIIFTGCNFVTATKNSGAYTELFNSEMTPVNTEDEKQKLLERQGKNGQ